MQSNAIIFIAIICGFFLVLLALVAFVVYDSRKENEQYKRIAHALEFVPLENTDELLQKVAFVRGLQTNGHHRLTHVYCCTHTSGAKTFMYNLSFRSHSRAASGAGRKTSYYPLETNALAFISPAWKLPRFNAFPRLRGSGTMAKLGNAVAEKAMGIKHETIKFPHIPKLEDQYLISTPEIPPSHMRPTDGFLSVLAVHPNLNLYVGDDTLTISFAGSTEFPSEEKMKQLYKIGVELAREL
jgi:hypothetical protein